MYTLACGLYAQYTRKDEFYIALLGLDNAGKSTLLERARLLYTPGATERAVHPTVGLSLGRVRVDGVQLNFWDLGGQRSLLGIWKEV